MTKLNERMEAGTDAATVTDAQVTSSSQTIAKPTVGCCTSMKQLLCWCVINSFNIEGQDGTKHVAIDFEELVDQFDYFFGIEKTQVVDAFTAGQINISNTLFQEYKERGFKGDTTIPENDKEDGIEYFNNTFY